MIGFCINLWKLACAVVHSLRTDRDFRGLMAVMLALLAGATYFYATIEGWGIVDAFYFSVMTMSTTGYGDLAPTSSLSKMFTVVFSLLSIGVFAAVASKIVVAVLARRRDKESSPGKGAKADVGKL